MKRLIIDTTEEKTTLILTAGREIINQGCRKDGGQLKNILPILKELGLYGSMNSIEQFIINNGPGRFTSIRIGLSFFKTAAQVTRKPIIAVSLFDAILTAWRKKNHQLTKQKEIFIVSKTFNNNLYVFTAPPESTLPERNHEKSSMLFLPENKIKEFFSETEKPVITNSTSLVKKFPTWTLLKPGVEDIINAAEKKMLASSEISFTAAQPLYIRDHYAAAER